MPAARPGLASESNQGGRQRERCAQPGAGPRAPAPMHRGQLRWRLAGLCGAAAMPCRATAAARARGLPWPARPGWCGRRTLRPAGTGCEGSRPRHSRSLRGASEAAPALRLLRQPAALRSAGLCVPSLAAGAHPSYVPFLIPGRKAAKCSSWAGEGQLGRDSLEGSTWATGPLARGLLSTSPRPRPYLCAPPAHAGSPQSRGARCRSCSPRCRWPQSRCQHRPWCSCRAGQGRRAVCDPRSAVRASICPCSLCLCQQHASAGTCPVLSWTGLHCVCCPASPARPPDHVAAVARLAAAVLLQRRQRQRVQRVGSARPPRAGEAGERRRRGQVAQWPDCKPWAGQGRAGQGLRGACSEASLARQLARVAAAHASTAAACRCARALCRLRSSCCPTQSTPARPPATPAGPPPSPEP